MKVYNKMYTAQRGRDNRRKNHLKRDYGLSLEDYDILFEFQGGGCGICGAPTNERYRKDGERFRSMCVDHDHETGQRRGLLCNRCNRALGLFGDDATVLRKAIAYLEYYRAPLYWEVETTSPLVLTGIAIGPPPNDVVPENREGSENSG